MVFLNSLTRHLGAMASPSVLPEMHSNTSTMAGQAESTPLAPQLALLDMFFPGFSMFAGIAQKYLHIDLNLYFSVIMFFGILTVIWNYSSSYFWEKIETHFMSSVDIRTDDEIYNILMTWVANQKFSQSARRFVVNADLSSRAWYLRKWDYDSDDEDADENSEAANKKALSYTPSFGTHYFWYKGRLLLFKRNSKEQNNSFMMTSEREEISICCFGRDPWIIKKLLHDARKLYNKKDQSKTLIYRGNTRAGSTETNWQRCLARNTRPFSTVILNEKTKKDLIDDVTDYLHPATQRWYSNRGIPYRRGYLLHGPPGTGKSSLSLALAGFFKMRIYIVSLSSVNSTEENLTSLFAELPRRCVVLLEDIDTAGLTHTREEGKDTSNDAPEPLEPGQLTPGNGNTNNKDNSSGRLSLSGLLNILDGVASQEGRVLIMTTNHVDKLDKALIRPGRVDMIIEFGRADTDMTAAIFRAIFAHLDADSSDKPANPDAEAEQAVPEDPDVLAKQAADKERKQKEDDARIEALALEFAARIPAHEFSPAELQGHLLRHKRDPRAAIDKAEEFVEQTRKDRKEKELKDAEEKRKVEEKKKKEEEKKKEDAAKKEKEDKKKAKKEERAKNRKNKSKRGSKSADEDSDSEAEGKEEASKESKKKALKDRRKKKSSKKADASDSDSDSSSSLSGDSSSDSETKKKAPAEKESLKPVDSSTQVDVQTKKPVDEKDSGYGTPASVEL